MGRTRIENRSPDSGTGEGRQSGTSRLAARAHTSSSATRDWLAAAALLAVLFLVYQPAWHGGMLWDDDAHLTRPELQSARGLWRIWFEPGATQQYYPLTHSLFWIEQRLWGVNPLGYHLVNIALHGLAALLVLRILRCLEVPGAIWAAAIFALHPLQVESVAWMTELKNTLSAVFYLGAMWSYLRFDHRRGKLGYALAVVLFVLALSSKTVTATLPAALLVIFWWRRGQLSWRRDVLPLVPLFLVGAATGLFTAWCEWAVAGAAGAEYTLGPVERLLIAGRAWWFYLGKLLWPADLIFSFPRWQISRAVWWQYAFPVAGLAVVAALWTARRRTRAPLAAALFFTVTLFPALGFFNVYPFRYSFVADHFQYLAGLGVIVLFSAAAARLTARLPQLDLRWAVRCLGVALPAALAVLSWRQCQIYGDAETLYRAIIARNSGCWMARHNLGNLLSDAGRLGEAMEQYQATLKLKPDHVESRLSLGTALMVTGRAGEAVEQYREAVRLAGDRPDAHRNLGAALAGAGRYPEAAEQYQLALGLRADDAKAEIGLANALTGLGRVDEAIAHCLRALRLNPNAAEAQNIWGNALLQAGRCAEAIDHYTEAVRIKPEFPEAHYNLGGALYRSGRVADSIEQYRAAVRFRPDFAEAHSNLSAVLLANDRIPEAVTHLREALRIRPDYADAHYNYGAALYRQGNMAGALAQWREVIQLQPDNVAALTRAAWMLAASNADILRSGAESLRYAERVRAIRGENDPAVLDLLAASYAEAGRFADAVRIGERALGAAARAGDDAIVKQIRVRLESYRSKRPYREPPVR